ncbi:MAG: hypothetical protein E7663_03140 [Ruminococcaceae bacterium]|nr:hypothetical protein [Oscillospiraceae bacterium]
MSNETGMGGAPLAPPAAGRRRKKERELLPAAMGDGELASPVKQHAGFSRQVISRARAYFDAPRWSESYRAWFFPTRAGLARELGITGRTLSEWEREHTALADVIADGMERSKELRIAFAEAEHINPTFCRFVLGALYGMKDGDAEEEGAEQKPFEVNIRVVK